MKEYLENLISEKQAGLRLESLYADYISILWIIL